MRRTTTLIASYKSPGSSAVVFKVGLGRPWEGQDLGAGESREGEIHDLGSGTGLLGDVSLIEQEVPD